MSRISTSGGSEAHYLARMGTNTAAAIKIAVANSAPAGIVLAAALFGAAHSYLGLSQAMQIEFLGTLSGILATWRRSVRPGMIAHTLQDLLGAVIRH